MPLYEIIDATGVRSREAHDNHAAAAGKGAVTGRVVFALPNGTGGFLTDDATAAAIEALVAKVADATPSTSAPAAPAS